jgi:hypothetical protein
VNFFLQINSKRAIAANHLIGAHAGACRDVTVRVRDMDLVGDVTHGMVGALDRSRGKPGKELLICVGSGSPGLRPYCETCGNETRHHIHKDSSIDS